MVGCSLFTLPAPCLELSKQHWLLPSFPPFVLGPFAASPSSGLGAMLLPLFPSSSSSSSSSWAPSPLNSLTIDVELYSLVLIASDLLLSLGWHFLICNSIASRPEFRLRFLSPSMRFTLGVCFGAVRLWSLAYIQPLPIHRALSQFSFLVAMVLGLTALVFNDGPWRSMRSNAQRVLNPSSLLNPAHLTKVTKQTLARNAIRRRLESGKTITLVLDPEGELVFCQQGAMLLRHAVLFRRANSGNGILHLLCRAEQCRSGQRFFFGYWHGAPFSHFGVGRLNVKQRAYVLDLMRWLNNHDGVLVADGSSSSGVEHDGDRLARFRLPKAAALELLRRGRPRGGGGTAGAGGGATAKEDSFIGGGGDVAGEDLDDDDGYGSGYEEDHRQSV